MGKEDKISLGKLKRRATQNDVKIEKYVKII